MNARSILIVDDEADLRWVLRELFAAAGFAVREAGDGAEAERLLQESLPQVILTDVRMPGRSGLDLLRTVRGLDPELPVILLSAVDEVATAVGAIKEGAFDWLEKPFDRQRLLAVVERAAEQRRLREEVRRLEQELARRSPGFGGSAAAKELETRIDRLARQGTLSLLITGESGTGKEVVAREIHRRSPQAAGPFVAIDCGALPEPLLESQLFGHKKGSFTGADRDHAGLFCAADGGSLFLDELANLPLALQGKLLRALQERTVTPVGGREPVPFRVRLLGATNAELAREIDAGRFRLDLYHRIAEASLRIPPLRERPEDLLPFAERFLAEANHEMGCHVAGFAPAAQQQLQRHAWPGNLRELRNVVRRAVVLCSGETIESLDLEAVLPGSHQLHAAGGDLSLAEQIRRASDVLEAEILRHSLAQAAGNKAAAARALKIDYTTLHRKLKRHGIGDPDRAPAP